MPKVLLTERGQGVRPAKLPVNPSARVDYFDEALPGFMCRVTPTGARTYAVWFRVNGEARRLTIGPVEAWSLADARARAAEVLRDAKAGVDAVLEAKKAKAEAQKVELAGETFEVLARRCLDDIKTTNPSRASRRTIRVSTHDAYLRTLEHDVFPAFGKVAPHEVTDAHVEAVIDRIAKRAPIQANRTLATVRRIFSWAVKKKVLRVNVAAGIEAPGEERNRERVYTNDELRGIFAAVRGTELENLVPMIAYTGVRSEEARSARWADMDRERKVWTIPASGTKEGKAHLVPLSAGALRVLKRIAKKGAFVFPAGTEEGYLDPPPVTITRPIAIKAGLCRNVGTEDEPEHEGDNFRLHDLRRTVRSRLPGLGVLPNVAERILGHALPGLQKVYDQHDYLPEMRSALEAWGGELDRILAKKEKVGKIAAFRRRA